MSQYTITLVIDKEFLVADFDKIVAQGHKFFTEYVKWRFDEINTGNQRDLNDLVVQYFANGMDLIKFMNKVAEIIHLPFLLKNTLYNVADIEISISAPEIVAKAS